MSKLFLVIVHVHLFGTLEKIANVNVALIYFPIFIDTQARKTAAAASDGSNENFFFLSLFLHSLFFLSESATASNSTKAFFSYSSGEAWIMDEFCWARATYKAQRMMEKLHVVHCHVHNNHDVIYGLESLMEEVHITKTMTMTCFLVLGHLGKYANLPIFFEQGKIKMVGVKYVVGEASYLVQFKMPTSTKTSFG